MSDSRKSKRDPDRDPKREQGAIEPARPRQLHEYTSPLKSAEVQVGEHVIAVLQQPETVAVLTTVLAGADGSQRIVSVGLDAARLEDVRELLAEAGVDEARRVPCIGFHCFLKDRDVKG
jgi:hypothetical protein